MSTDNGFRWYYSQDRERWRAAESRDDAIASGREKYRGAEFHICEANQLPLRDDFFHGMCVIDDFEDHNLELLDPEDRVDCISVGERNELETALSAAWAAWRAKHGKWKPFAFDQVRNEEMIEHTRAGRPTCQATHGGCDFPDCPCGEP